MSGGEKERGPRSHMRLNNVVRGATTESRNMWSTAYSMGRPSRHLGDWGSPVGPGRLRSGEVVAQTPCGGQIQAAYIRKTRAGRLRWFIVGLVCLGCGRFWRDIEPSLGFSYPEGHALHENRSQ